MKKNRKCVNAQKDAKEKGLTLLLLLEQYDVTQVL